MNFKILMSAMFLSSSLFAGQGSGTGSLGVDPMEVDDSQNTPGLRLDPTYRMLSNEDLTQVIRVSDEEMIEVLEAATKDGEVPLNTIDGVVTIYPEVIDLKNKLLDGIIIESGVPVSIREAAAVTEPAARTLRRTDSQLLKPARANILSN